jgi:hypothetical protein
VAKFITTVLWPALQALARWFTGTFIPAVAAAINFVRNNWKLLLAILTGPIGMAVLIVARHWNTIKTGASAVVKWVRDRFNSLVGFLRSLPVLMAAGARGMWEWLKNGLLAALNWIIRQINRALDAIDKAAGPYVNFGHIPSVGGGGGGSVSYKRPPRSGQAHGGITGAAAGGVRGRLTMVGEHGRELVNLPPGTRVHGNADTERMLGRGGGGRGVLVIDSSGASGLEALFFRWLREKIKSDHGGDVQAALGRG